MFFLDFTKEDIPDALTDLLLQPPQGLYSPGENALYQGTAFSLNFSQALWVSDPWKPPSVFNFHG
jgi:hypothetical protein